MNAKRIASSSTRFSFRNFFWLSATGFTGLCIWRDKPPFNTRQIQLDWDTDKQLTAVPLKNQVEIDRVLKVLVAGGFHGEHLTMDKSNNNNNTDNGDDDNKTISSKSKTDSELSQKLAIDKSSHETKTTVTDAASKAPPFKLYAVENAHQLCAVNVRLDGSGVDVYMSRVFLPHASTVGDLIDAHRLSKRLPVVDVEKALTFVPSLDTKVATLSSEQRRQLVRECGLLVYRSAEANAVLAEATMRAINFEAKLHPYALASFLVLPAVFGHVVEAFAKTPGTHRTSILVGNLMYSIGALTLDQYSNPRFRLETAAEQYGKQFCDAAIKQTQVLQLYNQTCRQRLSLAAKDSSLKMFQMLAMRVNALQYKPNGDFRGDIMFQNSKRIEKLESYKEKAEIELTQDSDNNNL